MAVTFDTLKKDATIFAELRKNPEWWQHFKEDTSLYIEIRKDNQVNVYFEGGSVARIHYCSKHKKLQVFTHHKYLGVPPSSKSNLYIECCDYLDEKDEKESKKNKLDWKKSARSSKKKEENMKKKWPDKKPSTKPR